MTITEYDMLVPVTSADGISFFYLPFRYIDPNGAPKKGVEPSNYQYVPNSARGYFVWTFHHTPDASRSTSRYASALEINEARQATGPGVQSDPRGCERHA